MQTYFYSAYILEGEMLAVILKKYSTTKHFFPQLMRKLLHNSTQYTKNRIVVSSRPTK